MLKQTHALVCFLSQGQRLWSWNNIGISGTVCCKLIFFPPHCSDAFIFTPANSLICIPWHFFRSGFISHVYRYDDLLWTINAQTHPHADDLSADASWLITSPGLSLCLNFLVFSSCFLQGSVLFVMWLIHQYKVMIHTGSSHRWRSDHRWEVWWREVNWLWWWSR